MTVWLPPGLPNPWALSIDHVLLLLVIITLAFPPFASSRQPAASETIRLPLAMEVVLKKPIPRRYELHIHVTNISEHTLTVDLKDLPWVPPNDAKWLQVSRLGPHPRPIDQHTVPGHYGSWKIPLLPGESIQEKITLNLRIPTLLDDIDRGGIRLHWDCPPPGLKIVCREGAPHTLIIPQSDPGHPDVYSIDETACRRMEDRIGLLSIPAEHQVLFLLTTESIMADLARIRGVLQTVDSYVRHCQPAWTNSWAVSFFTESEVAGFLKEGDRERFFEQGRWQRVNIGQYSSKIRRLFRFPWIKQKAETVYLSVFSPSLNTDPKSGRRTPSR